MTIFVATDSRAARKAFGSAERSRTYSVEFDSPEKLSQLITRTAEVPDSFLYVDVNGMDGRTLKRRLKRLRDVLPYRFGILDPTSEVVDVAELFHNAAADYVDKRLLGHGLATARLRRVVEYAPAVADPPRSNHVPDEQDLVVVPSGTTWSSVKSGHEYTFLMLYAALDHTGDLRRKSSEGFLSSLRKSFASLLERSFADHNARIWMWKEDEGLLLMPYDGGEVDVIVPALRLQLNRVLVNVEEFSAYGSVSWRLALHLGNTTFRSGNRTGEIVSESLNFVFHLGERFVEPGSLAVTAPVQARVPERVAPLLNHRGAFESVQVYALRDLL